MGLPINLEQLFDGSTIEWERIEFKEGWNPNEILHSISAFANDFNNWGGGYVIVGVKESAGKPILPPVGINIENVDKIQKELLNYCNLLKPNYFPIVEPVLFKNKWILIIWAPGGQNRPYKAPKDVHSKTKDYKIYIRHYSNTVPAKLDEERDLYNLAGNIPFDDRVHYNAEVSDLKLNLIKEFLGDVKSDLYDKVSDIPIESLGRQMNIVEGAQEYIKPKNIGILMFNDEPQKFIPTSQIELVHFQETSGDDIFIEKIFAGPIHVQIRNVLNYIKNSVIKEKIIKVANQAEAIRVFNYPYSAIEEAVVNAVYHRSYEERNPIEIRIDKEKITIVSFPGPDKSIRKSDIDSGQVIVRRYRNRRIGDFLKELKLTEGRATGIPKIIKSMKINMSPKPIFDTDEERTYFLVKLLLNEYFIEEKAQDEAQDKAQDKLTGKAHEIFIKNLNKTELRLMEILENKIMSKKELAHTLENKSISGNLKMAIDNLLKLGIIEYTLPDKPKSKNQQYRLTNNNIKLS